MTRTERQQEAVRNWIKAKGKGTIVMPTGTGKTFTSILGIKALLKKYPSLRILVVVPTTALKEQWIEKLNEHDIVFNVEVQVINTIIKHQWICDMLIIDEIHRTGSEQFSQIFNCVKYKLIMGLTATFDRLDGKERFISKYCPIVDEVTQLEALVNGWISEYKEYLVLLDVDDIDTYKNYNKEFIRYFEFFNYDFKKAMDCCGKNGWKAKINLRDQLYRGNDESKKKDILKAITVNSIGLMRTMQKRKAFINNHPKKIEIAKKIIQSRPQHKIITFSNNVAMAESISDGQYVYTGKTSKVKGRVMMEDFISGKINILNSCHKLNEGLDVPDISVGIILGTDSSETKARQRRGRATRKCGNKQAEIFYLVIKDTVEEKWVQNSHKNDRNFITIDESGLEKVLNGEQPETYKPKIGEIMFRF
jgi:superfamily II DNA or RNA helicase